mmetsp:Transcript_30652/g.47045  ORF Transcript_30652/g.47045 Transcript_30652/m.47045 type:complete len:85 (+) Transcript_30652:866-1120(+)
MKNPDGIAYPPPGNARNAMNPHVTKTPNTPKIDTGASAASDDKLQSGSNVQAVVAKIDAWRVAQSPFNPAATAILLKASPSKIE